MNDYEKTTYISEEEPMCVGIDDGDSFLDGWQTDNLTEQVKLHITKVSKYKPDYDFEK